jgi:hypothetical protein
MRRIVVIRPAFVAGRRCEAGEFVEVASGAAGALVATGRFALAVDEPPPAPEPVAEPAPAAAPAPARGRPRKAG